MRPSDVMCAGNQRRGVLQSIPRSGAPRSYFGFSSRSFSCYRTNFALSGYRGSDVAFDNRIGWPYGRLLSGGDRSNTLSYGGFCHESIMVGGTTPSYYPPSKGISDAPFWAYLMRDFDLGGPIRVSQMIFGSPIAWEMGRKNARYDSLRSEYLICQDVNRCFYGKYRYDSRGAQRPRNLNDGLIYGQKRWIKFRRDGWMARPLLTMGD